MQSILNLCRADFLRAVSIFTAAVVASALVPSVAAPVGPETREAGSGPTTDPAVPVRLNANAFSTMNTLDDKKKLGLGDHLSFRIVEDQEDPKEPLNPKPPLVVTDSGDVEVPYIGRFPAQGKTCKQLARELKTELEKKYYYRATVIIALDLVSKTTGKVYVLGEVRVTGPVDLPGDETLTVGRAILRAGGFTIYSDKHHVKVTRKSDPSNGKPQTFVVDAGSVLEKGKAELDVNLEPGDLIYVPTRLISF